MFLLLLLVAATVIVDAVNFIVIFPTCCQWRNFYLLNLILSCFVFGVVSFDIGGEKKSTALQITVFESRRIIIRAIPLGSRCFIFIVYALALVNESISE